MNIRPGRFLFILSLLALLPACDKPTYPKEKVVESVLKLCKDEYGLRNVEAKIIGSTLGVFIPIEGLLDPDLKLNQEAVEKIENVALSIHRVVTSTDSPLKFYTLTARDMDSPAAEFVLTGFIYDVVRVRLLDISRDEYYKRILRDFKFNTIVAGGAKIKELFEALNENSPLTENIKPIFYPIYVIGKSGSQKIEIVGIDAKEISEQEALFYVKTKEYYDPLPGADVYKALFPSGFNNEYLILVNITMFPNPMKEIVAKYFYTGAEIRQRNLRETFDQYYDIGYIGLDGLPKKDLETGWFFSQQIARRIKMFFEEDRYLKERFTLQASQGSMDNKVFSFRYSITSIKPSLADDNKIMVSKILKLISVVLHRYEFEDFEGVELIDAAEEQKSIYLSKEDLENFRRNHLKIQNILLQ